MTSHWSDAEAEALARQLAAEGVSRPLALKIFATRRLGADPALVLHGGGNTSLKTEEPDLLGEPVRVLRVKGSGRDMAAIDAAHMPAVRLDPLLRLRRLPALDDETMVDALRGALMSPRAPSPSVEALLHAFLPHTSIDHTHAEAVLALANQPDGAALCRAVFGGRLGIVPYMMSGFALARRAAEVYEADPTVEGLILMNHGIVTFGDDPRQSFERMIEMVGIAARRLAEGRRVLVPAAPAPACTLPLAEIAPRLRGQLATDRGEGVVERWILEPRTSAEVRAYVDGADLARYSQQGVVTPDHVIRTKPWPVILPPAEGEADAWSAAAGAAIAAFEESYRAYFNRNTAQSGGDKVALDPVPRVALIPGFGLFGIGASAAEARISADLAEATVRGVTLAESVGRFTPVAEADLFDLEYWSLEQAKLGRRAEPALARQVVAVTGGGSGIGAATAQAFAAQGAEVVVLDLSAEAADSAARAIGPWALGLACDVTDPDSVAAAFARIAERFGGLDVLVSNAGAAWQGRIGGVDPAVLRRSFELNFFGHQSVAQAAVRLFQAQGTGGCLLFNASKQAVNPGRDFGPYGLPKAATMFLMKQYALDHGREGIRSNAINADRIRTGLLTAEMIASRSKARGLSEKDYMAGNLLAREVTAEDVADAFVWLARAHKVTACTLTVDGGNIEASLR